MAVESGVAVKYPPFFLIEWREEEGVEGEVVPLSRQPLLEKKG